MVRDLDPGSQGRSAPAGDHSRLILRPGANLAHSRAAHTHRLLGWGGRSSHLPLLIEIQRDPLHLPDRAKRSRVRAQEKRAALTLQATRPPTRALEWSSRCMVRVPKSESDRVQHISSRVAPAVKEVENGSDRHV